MLGSVYTLQDRKIRDLRAWVCFLIGKLGIAIQLWASKYLLGGNFEFFHRIHNWGFKLWVFAMDHWQIPEHGCDNCGHTLSQHMDYGCSCPKCQCQWTYEMLEIKLNRDTGSFTDDWITVFDKIYTVVYFAGVCIGIIFALLFLVGILYYKFGGR